ncbi:hypothetical protein B0T11DRAFT_332778 [Plectosphaerella cucumerina]|uniref:Uncharacterized protein n=1 Tax=Plectosphaerella cucumerina TaxID=40658 RepID=A0A8K0TAF3_9PEZI|nr:hypothetical protein B0T11DRAFT_332778 [Plectosphaerella cucumerina]
MSNKNKPPVIKKESSPEEEVWDEQRLKESLDQLKILHIQLRELRTTIPRMLEPLRTKQQTPEALFDNFSQAVAASHKEVQDFTELIKDPKSTSIFQYAEQSRKENPKGIKPWTGKEEPDWTTPPGSS